MKALCVFSGGLDSMLAACLIRAQGIDVLALFFETPFFTSERPRKSALSMDLPFKVVDITERHLEIVKHPKHGYGANANPCIDCHTLMFRVAGEMLEQEGASFILTGEVLGQRPMSQNRHSLSLIKSESGLDGLLLRPLSARHLPLTTPEKEGWVDRDLLKDFHGRSRKPQMELARRLGIKDYPAPAGGCLLTEKVFSQRLKDLLTSQADIKTREIELLKLGRHFRLSSHAKIVVGRDKAENERISALSGDRDIILTALTVPGPTVLMSGEHLQESLELAAAITLAYSDGQSNETLSVRVTGRAQEEMLTVKVQDKGDFRDYMINQTS
ncbi:MAG: tRNA 4-thiouridine(8) synthase ThiI [Desulfobacterales bacterium]|nr:tRNA 4-thiouridine(8) synthase ThiI [Desulfobacterales bacterium]